MGSIADAIGGVIGGIGGMIFGDAAGAANGNLQPYVVVKMWQRTA